MKNKIFILCVCLTRCRWGLQVNLLAVLPEARLVAAPHPQHVHAVDLQPVHHGAGPSHFVQVLPSRGGVGRPDAPPGGGAAPRLPLVLHGEVPGLGRVLRKAPAQEQLVVRQRLLGVDDRSQRSCRGGDNSGPQSSGIQEPDGFLVGKTEPTANELQAVDELDFFGRVQVKVSEGRVDGQGETLEVRYCSRQPAGGRRRRPEEGSNK